jgi:NACHT domain
MISVAEIAASLIEILQSPDLKTGETFLQEKLSRMLKSNNSSTFVSQIWATMHLKLDFPRCTDSYVPQIFSTPRPTDASYYYTYSYNFGEVVSIVANSNKRLVLISAPPGMGKSRASEEIYTQLVLRGHFAVYVKLSQIISFWTKCDDNPSVRDFLQECIDEDKFRRCWEEDEMIVVMDGFDEVCPQFKSEVVALINKLLVKGIKVLVTSRPQEKDDIIKGLKQDTNSMFIIEIRSFSLDQKVLMLETRLHLGVNRLAKIVFSATVL